MFSEHLQTARCLKDIYLWNKMPGVVLVTAYSVKISVWKWHDGINKYVELSEPRIRYDSE